VSVRRNFPESKRFVLVRRQRPQWHRACVINGRARTPGARSCRHSMPCPHPSSSSSGWVRSSSAPGFPPSRQWSDLAVRASRRRHIAVPGLP